MSTATLLNHADRSNRATRRRGARIAPVDRLEYFLRSRGAKVVVLALVANTMVAQLLYNSAGQLVLGNGVLLAQPAVQPVGERRVDQHLDQDRYGKQRDDQVAG